VSPKQSVEIPSAEVVGSARDVEQYAPLYVAVYAAEHKQQSKATWKMALHLAATHDAGSVVKYSCRYDEASNCEEASKWTCETERVDTATEKDLIARVLIGHVPKTSATTEDTSSEFDHTATQITNLLSTLPISQSAASQSESETHSSRTWLMAAITSLRTSGLLVETPTLPASTSKASSSASKPTDATSSATRPKLTSNPTDNWNDLPADFLSPDAAPGGSHRRKMRNSTPRITPRSSSGQLGEVGGAAATKPEVAVPETKAKSEEAHELKSAEAILERTEEWAEKTRKEWQAGEGNVEDEGEEGNDVDAGRRVRTLDVRSGLEVKG
jgi:hypothetical protein